MKQLKTVLTAIAMLNATLFASAHTQPKQDKSTLAFSITAYLNMVNSGNTKDYASVLADDVKFNTTRGGKIITHGKNEELDFIRQVGNVKQNCKTDYSTINSSENYCVIKVTMAYDSFTKENIISFSKTNSGWKITDVTFLKLPFTGYQILKFLPHTLSLPMLLRFAIALVFSFRALFKIIIHVLQTCER